MKNLSRRSVLKLSLALTTVLAGPAFAEGPQKVLLLINGNLGDKSFFDSAANGMDLIKAKYGDAVETQVLEVGADPTKWEPALLDASEGDWSLIIAGTYQMAETVGTVAKQYPEKRYVIYDASVPYEDGGYDNVYSIQYNQNQGSYLGGVLAAGLVKSGVAKAGSGQLGFIGGMDIPVINDFLVGYVAGAQSVLPDIKVQISYVGDFSDAAKGKELGLAQYNSGVSVGFSAASQAGLGQLAAAKETGTLALGVDSDQEAIFAESDPEIAKLVVSSVLKNVDASLLATYDAFVAGNLAFGTVQVMGMKEGAVGLVEGGNMAKLAPLEVIAAVQKAKDDIASGAVTVPSAFGMTTEQINAVRDAVRP